MLYRLAGAFDDLAGPLNGANANVRSSSGGALSEVGGRVDGMKRCQINGSLAGTFRRAGCALRCTFSDVAGTAAYVMLGAFLMFLVRWAGIGSMCRGRLYRSKADAADEDCGQTKSHRTTLPQTYRARLRLRDDVNDADVEPIVPPKQNRQHLELLHVVYVEETGMGVSDTAKFEIPQGTLDLLILQIAALGPIHGYAIAQRLQQVSREVLQVQQGTLYPALHRLENKGYLKAEWKESETKREAKFYRLTAKGRKQLETETAKWTRLAEVVGLVLALSRGATV